MFIESWSWNGVGGVGGYGGWWISFNNWFSYSYTGYFFWFSKSFIYQNILYTCFRVWYNINAQNIDSDPGGRKRISPRFPSGFVFTDIGLYLQAWVCFYRHESLFTHMCMYLQNWICNTDLLTLMGLYYRQNVCKIGIFCIN